MKNIKLQEYNLSLAIFAVVAVSVAVDSYILYKLWEWFFPASFGLLDISILESFWVLVILRFFSKSNTGIIKSYVSGEKNKMSKIDEIKLRACLIVAKLLVFLIVFGFSLLFM